MKQVAFGKYTLLRRLARGGMAELYLARSSGVANVQRMVVIKLVASRFAEDESFVTMFQDEVRIAAMLNHPGIGQVFEVGEVGGNLYLAMEFLHGQDLRASVRQSLKRRKEPVPVAVAALVGAKVCSALEYAHNARTLEGEPLSIIHRDLSPSNIMLTYDGNVKLVDFGIAKAANRISLTQPGLIKGKVRYLSPEQVLGNQVDHRCDIFTLGTSLWEATVGRHLFEGKRDIQIYEQISKGQVRPPGAMRPDYPKQLEAVLMKALARDPDHRYPSARAMQADLEQFAVDIGVPLSDIALSRYMHDLFEREMSSWEQAKQSGKSLLQHMLDITPAEDLTRDLEAALSHEDERLTRPAKDHELSSARGSFTTTAPESKSSGDHRPTRIEIPDRKPKPAPKPAAAAGKAEGDRGGGERKTIMFGELNAADVNYQNPAKPQASSVGPITLGRGDRRSKPPTGAHKAINKPVNKPIKRRETSDLMTSATPTASPDAQRRGPSAASAKAGRPPDSGSFPNTGPRRKRAVSSEAVTITPGPGTPSLDDLRNGGGQLQAKTLIASSEDHEPADSSRPTMIDSLLRSDSNEQTGVLKAGATAVPDQSALAGMARPRQPQPTGPRQPMSTGPRQPQPTGPSQQPSAPSQPAQQQQHGQPHQQPHGQPHQQQHGQPHQQPHGQPHGQPHQQHAEPRLQQPGHAAPPHAQPQQSGQHPAAQPQAYAQQPAPQQSAQQQQWQASQGQGQHPMAGADHDPNAPQPAVQTVSSRDPVILGRDPGGTAPTQAQPQQAPAGAMQQPGNQAGDHDATGDDESDKPGAEKKKKTGDWSHQSTAEQEERPGTHPYFKEEGRTIIGEGRVQRPGRRPASKAPLIGLIIFLVLAGGAAAVFFGFFYNKGDDDDGGGAGSASGSVQTGSAAGSGAGSASAAAKGSAAAKADEDKVRLTSEPSGAIVFLAESGEEIGPTPLTVPRSKLGDGRIEVFHKGFKTVRVTIRHDVTAKTIKLKKGKSGRRPRRHKKGAKGSGSDRRKKASTETADILDPFSKKKK